MAVSRSMAANMVQCTSWLTVPPSSTTGNVIWHVLWASVITCGTVTLHHASHTSATAARKLRPRGALKSCPCTGSGARLLEAEPTSSDPHHAPWKHKPDTRQREHQAQTNGFNKRCTSSSLWGALHSMLCSMIKGHHSGSPPGEKWRRQANLMTPSGNLKGSCVKASRSKRGGGGEGTGMPPWHQASRGRVRPKREPNERRDQADQ